MPRGRNRHPTKCTNASTSSSRPGRDPIFNGSEASSVPPSRPPPSFRDMGIPPLRFPYEMSETSSEAGRERYRGKPLYSVYEGDYSEDGSGSDDDDSDQGTEVGWDPNDPGFRLGPRDQFREDRPRTPPPSPSLPSEQEDYRPFQESSRSHWSHRSDRDSRPGSYPSQSRYSPLSSQFKDRLAYDAYRNHHGVHPDESDYTRSDYTFPDRDKRGCEYVDPARRKFVRSRPRSLGSHDGKMSKTGTGKRGILDGKSEVEVTLCSVM